MKSAVLILAFTMLSTGVSFPSLAQNNQQQTKPNMRNYSIKTSSYMMGKYSRMLNDMISGALRMDLTEKQKTKVSRLREDYLYPMTKEENTLRSANMNILKMVENPAFEPAKVKEEIGKSSEMDKKLSDGYVDCLASLRDTIGGEKYENLSKSVSRYRDNLAQMRKGDQTHHRSRSVAKGESSNRQTHSMMKSEPVKTGTPAPPSPESKN